ncbi:ATP-dependent DNA helicase [Aphis craccivora]|uniref:ATP-dependent DNA helicase n=1 Tax=Aphis craccivora TaxID=307492 RepID=A0A6G0ZFZ8_APHCR|nr:ATP-dependent DNA helicase [Aphis craccivora]
MVAKLQHTKIHTILNFWTDLSRSTSKARNLRNNRSERTEEQIQQQNTDARVHRAFISDSFPRLAFQYEPDIEYYAHSKVVTGAMDKECPHFHALKFKNEPAGMCCASGKVQLSEIETPPEPGNNLYGKTTFAGYVSTPTKHITFYTAFRSQLIDDFVFDAVRETI